MTEQTTSVEEQAAPLPAPRPADELPAEPPVEPSVDPAAEPSVDPAAEPSVDPAAGPPAEAPAGVPAGPPVKKDRRVLRAVLRWTAATVVFAAVGTSAAYGITRMERTDVPGLATESDGRWDYPEITMPPLPAGSPRPFDEANKAGTHYADLRGLVLPAPKGAKADTALRGEDGWLATKTFLAEYASKDDRETIGQLLTDNGLRNIAARGWRTPDGTHTRIYLLHFGTAAVVDELGTTDLTSYNSPEYAMRGAAGMSRDQDYPARAGIDDVDRSPYAETKPYGAEQVREAYLEAGDTLAVIVQSRKGVTEAVPFQQTVALQSQLLG
ncbi:hypothetical protein OHB41_22660 [Streptomyces sp. NBC_01571]|uniref:hypothetical protein n=1 Tax=Streptomyces sp. NBC_01571 TaxID=2975883 RepID=UPI00224ECD56|nr:hypothetical protein [Streptomyces sp. NBC_01571]MCX4575943.1 hypothetical protein [Streptomyces sp. NBC_01571]